MKTKIAKIIPVLLIAVLLMMMCGGWFVANRIREGVLEQEVSVELFDLKVVALEHHQITLRKTSQTEENEWKRGGIWGLRWKEGYARLGEVFKTNEQETVRKFIPLKGTLNKGDMARLEAFAFPDNPEEAFGLSTRKVFYSSPLGELPACFLGGLQSSWVIFVHGKRDYPARSPFRSYPILPVVAQAGFPFLIITYRNDLGVPKNEDGYHWYGQTEWKDLEGAADYAFGHGAKDLILVGYSMGGAIVMNFLCQSSLADKVRGVILDSPMLDLEATIDLGARLKGLPKILTSVGKFVAGSRFNIKWRAFNYLRKAKMITVPILLFHGDSDRTVPVETSDALAKARPDIVKYHRIPGATHIRSWNMNPYEYERAVNGFLTTLTEQNSTR